jgi:catechol 2,3-dioxygenase-like lactoylglutathione lyase family enzyme
LQPLRESNYLGFRSAKGSTTTDPKHKKGIPRREDQLFSRQILLIFVLVSQYSKMTLQKLSPILWTKDLKETILFYETVLGFGSKSNFPNFVSLTRENVEIMFIVPQDEPDDCKDPNDQSNFFPKPTLTGSIFIVMTRVDELWEVVKNKAKIKTSIGDREYWMRDFSVLDNNGYELVFGEDITPQVPPP